MYNSEATQMRFLWDENKNRRNRTKHKVSFEAAIEVFGDPYAISQLDRIVEGEQRWLTLGQVGSVVVLIVAHTYVEAGGEEFVRIISARKATPRERTIYEEGL
jgi:uncharacterized DUF497 family protein